MEEGEPTEPGAKEEEAFTSEGMFTPLALPVDPLAPLVCPEAEDGDAFVDEALRDAKRAVEDEDSLI